MWATHRGNKSSMPGNSDGFKLKWHFKGLNASDFEIENDQTAKWGYKSSGENLSQGGGNMRSMLNFVREGRRKRMSDKALLDSVLKHRWSVHVLKKGRLCLNESEIHRVIVKAAQDLDLVIGFNGWVPEDDLKLGGKLLLMVTICPAHLIEAAKLSVLFEALINYFGLDTLITATINSVQPRAGGSIKDFTSSNMWFQRLNQKFNFSLGPFLEALSTSEQLTRLQKLHPPFLNHLNTSSKSHQIEGESFSRLMHPPHLLDEEQVSTFIPFCAFSTGGLPKQQLEETPFPFCDAFQPTILGGQLCYKVKVNQTSGKGPTNQLMILLDYQEDLSIQPPFDERLNIDSIKIDTINLNDFGNTKLPMNEAKIQLDTLPYDVGFGEGVYKMSVVKKMKAKSAFLGLGLKDRKCQVAPFQECQTKALLEDCKCVPLELRGIQVFLFLKKTLEMEVVPGYKLPTLLTLFTLLTRLTLLTLYPALHCLDCSHCLHR